MNATWPITRTSIPYRAGPTSYESECCLLDLYLPDVEPFPFVVWFHGGGLEGGDKADDLPTIVAETLQKHDIGTALPNYRLFPRADFPAYLEDAAAAFAWCVAEVEGIRPGKVFIGGHSAGAYLAAMIGADGGYLEAHGLEFADIAGVIPVSGQMITHARVRQERGLPVDTPLIDAAAPIWHVAENLPPFLNITGDNDMPRRSQENHDFLSAMKQAGHGAVEFHEIAGRDHDSIMRRVSMPEDTVMRLMLDFIARAGGATLERR